MAHIQKSTGYNVQWMSTISLCRFFEIPYGRSFYYVSLSSDLRQPPHQICGVLGLQFGSQIAIRQGRFFPPDQQQLAKLLTGISCLKQHFGIQLTTSHFRDKHQTDSCMFLHMIHLWIHLWEQQLWRLFFILVTQCLSYTLFKFPYKLNSMKKFAAPLLTQRRNLSFMIVYIYVYPSNSSNFPRRQMLSSLYSKSRTQREFCSCFLNLLLREPHDNGLNFIDIPSSPSCHECAPSAFPHGNSSSCMDPASFIDKKSANLKPHKMVCLWTTTKKCNIFFLKSMIMEHLQRDPQP